jgi:hypothetical protein
MQYSKYALYISAYKIEYKESLKRAKHAEIENVAGSVLACS